VKLCGLTGKISISGNGGQKLIDIAAMLLFIQV
jgi:hypothetical protein